MFYVVSTRYTRTMTACSIRPTLGITIISFMSFKFLKITLIAVHGIDGAEW